MGVIGFDGCCCLSEPRIALIFGMGRIRWWFEWGLPFPSLCPHPRIKSGAGSSPLPPSGRGDLW